MSDPQRRPRPIPGSRPWEKIPDKALWNGNCPVCEAQVLWAVNRTGSEDGSVWHSPLDPEFVKLPHEPRSAYVLISSSGMAEAISPVVHPVHVCPPEVVHEILLKYQALGFYTTEVLSEPCPVRPCGAAPGMLCLTQRREVLHQPHGARVVRSRGEDLEDSAY